MFLCNKLFRTVGAYFDFFTKHFLVFLFSGALPMVRGTTHSLGVGGYPNENGHPSGLPITPPLGSLKIIPSANLCLLWNDWISAPPFLFHGGDHLFNGTLTGSLPGYSNPMSKLLDHVFPDLRLVFLLFIYCLFFIYWSYTIWNGLHPDRWSELLRALFNPNIDKPNMCRTDQWVSDHCGVGGSARGVRSLWGLVDQGCQSVRSLWGW